MLHEHDTHICLNNYFNYLLEFINLNLYVEFTDCVGISTGSTAVKM